MHCSEAELAEVQSPMLASAVLRERERLAALHHQLFGKTGQSIALQGHTILCLLGVCIIGESNAIDAACVLVQVSCSRLQGLPASAAL